MTVRKYHWRESWEQIAKGFDKSSKNVEINIILKKIEIFSNLIDQCGGLINNIHIKSKNILKTQLAEVKFYKIKRALLRIEKDLENYFYPTFEKKLKN